MRVEQGRESYVAIPRWMGLGAMALMVVTALISVVGLMSLSGRVQDVEGRSASTARAVGEVEQVLSAKIDGLAERVDSTRTDLAGIGKLGARITNLADDLAAQRGGDKSRGLAAALARLESSVSSLKGDVDDAKRLAAKAAEAKPSEPVTPAVTADELDRIAGRIAGIETRVGELGRKASISTTKPRTRINEEAVKKLVEDTVKEQVEAEFKKMRERWTGRRGGGGGDGGGN